RCRFRHRSFDAWVIARTWGTVPHTSTTIRAKEHAMKIFTYLAFDGQCAEAFRFYEKVLGGKIEMLMTFGESPMAGEVGPDWQDRVIHAYLVADGAAIMGGDAPPGTDVRPAGFSVNAQVDSVQEAERIFNALAEGGNITMPLQASFWAERFGMLTDRFGVPWMVNGPARS